VHETRFDGGSHPSPNRRQRVHETASMQDPSEGLTYPLEVALTYLIPLILPLESNDFDNRGAR
jgi:hypothetical protein